jgi:hypothetical protein
MDRQAVGLRHRDAGAIPVGAADRGAADAEHDAGRQVARRPVGGDGAVERGGVHRRAASVGTLTRFSCPMPAIRAALSTEEWVSAEA